MNILAKVTRKTLLKNKVRTLVTIVGILLSAAMITAVTVSVSSFQRYLQDLMVAYEGKWHVAFFNVDAEGRRDLEADERTDSAAWAQVNWAVVREDPDDEDEDTPILCAILGADAAFMDRMPVSLSSGRLPENPHEIVLPLTTLGSQTTHLGDTVTLDLGDRVVDGQTLGFGAGPLLSDETLRVRETKTFTVVGYLDNTRFDQSSGAAVTCLTCWDDQDTGALLNGYLLLNNPRDTYQMQVDYRDRFRSVDNDDYLMTLGVARYDTFNTVLYSFAAILIGLIMFGSVSLIYNAFSISVAERTKQFGLLRSVGATKKQIRSMVFTEAMTVSAIGIPMGILSGMLGMGVTFHFIGGSLGSLFSDTIGAGADAPALSLRVTPVAVLAAAVIGLVTVLISAWVPSRRARRVSAIEAIRQSGDVRVKPREVRTSKLTYKLFGLEGAIASKHFKRNRKGYRATVVSLFMSVVLFISASSFCRYLTDMVMAVFDDYDYDISLYSYKNTAEPSDTDPGGGDLGPLTQIFSQVDSVETVTGIRTAMNVEGIELTRDMVPERTWELIMGDSEGEVSFKIFAHVYGVEDSAYRAYLRAHGLDEEEYMGEDPKLVVRGRIRGFNTDTQRMEGYDLFREDLKTLTLRLVDHDAADEFYNTEEYKAMSPEEQDAAIEERFTYAETYEIGLVTEDLIPGVNGNTSMDTIIILMPLSEIPRIDRSSGERIEMFFTVSDHENGLSDLVSAAQAAGYELSEGDFTDLYANTAARRSIVTVVRVISYGFITLISLIAALNVFNTISTNILLRRREFAMLRSVGMTDRGFDRMMNFECLLYGAKSLLFGIPAAFGITYLIFLSVQAGMDTGFYLPWSAVAIAVASVFLVVFASMLYAMSGIKKDNPIEAMKNEVI